MNNILEMSDEEFNRFAQDKIRKDQKMLKNAVTRVEKQKNTLGLSDKTLALLQTAKKTKINYVKYSRPKMIKGIDYSVEAESIKDVQKDLLSDDGQMNKDIIHNIERTEIEKIELEREYQGIKNTISDLETVKKTLEAMLHTRQIDIHGIKNAISKFSRSYETSISYAKKNKELYRVARRNYREMKDLQKKYGNKIGYIKRVLNENSLDVEQEKHLKSIVELLVNESQKLKTIEEIIYDLEKLSIMLTDIRAGNVKSDKIDEIFAGYNISGIKYKNEVRAKKALLDDAHNMSTDKNGVDTDLAFKELKVKDMIKVLENIHVLEFYKLHLVQKGITFSDYLFRLDSEVKLMQDKIEHLSKTITKVRQGKTNVVAGDFEFDSSQRVSESSNPVQNNASVDANNDQRKSA